MFYFLLNSKFTCAYKLIISSKLIWIQIRFRRIRAYRLKCSNITITMSNFHFDWLCNRETSFNNTLFMDKRMVHLSYETSNHQLNSFEHNSCFRINLLLSIESQWICLFKWVEWIRARTHTHTHTIYAYKSFEIMMMCRFFSSISFMQLFTFQCWMLIFQ